MDKTKILVVDDQEVNRYLLGEIFQDGYEILEAADGRSALKIIEQERENIGLVLLDIIMPGMDGFGVMEVLKVKDYLTKIPVIMITGETSVDVEHRGFEVGVADFIVKPFNPPIVRKRAENIMELYRHKNRLEALVKEQTDKIEQQARQMKNQIIDTLSSVVEFRNLESGQHIKRIKGFTEILAKCISRSYREYNLDADKIEMIVAAASMHDIGKIAIPDHILMKPGKLTEDEFSIMRTHTMKGCEILDMLDFIDDKQFYDYCHDICRHHHEKYDGKGYPDGLKGEEISIAAQIVSIADVYDALVSERVYKTAYPPDKAYEMILKGECGVFNPKLMECLTMVKPQFEKFEKENQEIVWK